MPTSGDAVLGDHRVSAESDGVLHQDGIWTWWSDPQAAIRGPVGDGTAVVQDPRSIKPCKWLVICAVNRYLISVPPRVARPWQ